MTGASDMLLPPVVTESGSAGPSGGILAGIELSEGHDEVHFNVPVFTTGNKGKGKLAVHTKNRKIATDMYGYFALCY